MTKREEIKEEIWQIWQILLVAKESYSYSFYLNKPDTDEELQYLNNSKHFQFIRITMWKMFVIELSKLFKDSAKSDRYNIFHFIRKLKKDGYFGKMGISEIKTEEWEEHLNRNRETISKILILRDKLYSHTDTDKEKYKNTDISFEETEQLIKIIELIIQEIYSTVFDTHALIETIFFNRERFKLIEILAKERIRSREELLNKYLNNRK